MAKMTLKLYTTLKDKIGASRVEVEADTAAQAVARLRERYADIVNATLVDAQGVVRNHFTLTLNSQILDPLKLEGVTLKDGDLLHIFPPIAGGVSAPLARSRSAKPCVRTGGTETPSPVLRTPAPLREREVPSHRGRRRPEGMDEGERS
jgi:molybdopterin converting factor small subunit